MPISILSAKDMVALEHAAFAQGQSLSGLMNEAVKACTQFVTQTFPRSTYQHVAILAGRGHNGGDALGLGCELLRAGRTVSALLCWTSDDAKSATKTYLKEFKELGGLIYSCSASSDFDSLNLKESFSTAELWIDGLYGYGLNRPARGIDAAAIEFVNQFEKQKIALDVPSGLSCDLGNLGGPFICANHTLALGALKPIHLDDSLLSALGEVHWLDLDLLKHLDKISVPRWFAAHQNDFRDLLQEARRTPDSHKISNGRLLIVAGSKRYPGAGVLTCLGAQISGAGMIHAWVPEKDHHPLLTTLPEIILERSLPRLDSFDAIVLGPGWVPGDTTTFNTVIQHAMHRPDTCLVLDAGAFPFVTSHLQKGHLFGDNVVLTPHSGEFSRLFPEPFLRINSKYLEQRIHRIEAASWASKMCLATVVLKGARTHVATPDGEVLSVMRSTPLLAHAGHGDVLAGLIGGLAAGGLKSKKAALLAALMQAETGYWFSSQFPTALTLPPVELVRQMQRLPHP